MSHGKPAQRGALRRDDDFTIAAKYASEYRGLVQYYLLAQDVFRVDTLRWVTETSMLKILAGKHKSSVNTMAAKYKAVIDTPRGIPGRRPPGPRQEATGCPIRRHPAQTPTHSGPVRPVTDHGRHQTLMASTKRNELIHRLVAGGCEWSTDLTS
jgi:hypothetical protein